MRGQWEERFERRYGFWRGFVDEQVRRYLDCGIYENGFAQVRCPDCAEEYLLAFVVQDRELMIAATGAPHRDVPGTAMCQNDHPALRRASHNADAGHSTGTAPHSGCSGSDGGRRRVISVVADLPASLRTTTLMARRWDAKGGPEGRSFRVA